MLNEDSGKPFKCEQCDYSSNRSFDLRRHKKRHTKIRPLEGSVFQCSECSFTTKWKRNLRRHMLTHNMVPVKDQVDPVEDKVDDPVDEPVNEDTFEEFIVELIEDSNTASNKEPAKFKPIEKFGVTQMKFFVCGQCHYTSNRAFDLRRHEQTHSRVKNIDGTAFKCLKCPFITKWKRNMKRHLLNKRHINLSNELCTDQLDDQSSDELIVQLINSDDLRSEYDTDTVEYVQSDNSETPPFLPTCNSPINESEAQIDPQTSTDAKDNESNGNKRFKCAQCHYESKRAFDLRRHEQRHKKVKIVDGIAVKCTECSFVTKWKRNMRRHMKQHNPKDIPAETPILDKQLSKLDEEANCDVESQTILIEPLYSEFNSEAIQINDLEIYEERSEVETEALESDEDSDVLPSYWQAIEQDTECVFGS
ncbi:transcriptional repressor CTCF-like [Drosophila innubila]|uniref:transcriptional repressor CTCF-like n=1 Tax=Drosophila innubila TaxID=198719 RepID=UPI00148E4061|nr:transcriptional repressor CTCF-like [Drosophila innubila]